MINRPPDRFIPAREPLGVWIEEMKPPTLTGPDQLGASLIKVNGSRPP